MISNIIARKRKFVFPNNSLNCENRLFSDVFAEKIKLGCGHCIFSFVVILYLLKQKNIVFFYIKCHTMIHNPGTTETKLKSHWYEYYEYYTDSTFYSKSYILTAFNRYSL